MLANSDEDIGPLRRPGGYVYLAVFNLNFPRTESLKHILFISIEFINMTEFS